MKRRRRLMITLVVLILLMTAFSAYGWFFRHYLDPQLYLDMARQHVEYDPYLGNWQQPDFEMIWQQGRPYVHFTFVNDRPGAYADIDLYIEPFSKTVSYTAP
ncbi:MAG: hypothetical protein EOM13_00120 [Clostridia bacterium]|nr:hypothetical protein [Eubacteriales bacterium]NCC47447.1 hypothetical protein [Clostridia bacterium]